MSGHDPGAEEDPELELTAVAVCTKCGLTREWPDVAQGAGRPISGDETLTVEHHAACPMCGGRRVWVRILDDAQAPSKPAV